jgi:hypothetical protein
MTPKELARQIKSFFLRTPITAAFEGAWKGQSPAEKEPWYKTQKQHWLGWLKGYAGPGFYNRQSSNRDARFIYNHINCVPMLLWLAEASRVPRPTLLKAKRAGLSAGPRFAAQCGAIREIIPWEMVEAKLGVRPKTPL